MLATDDALGNKDQGAHGPAVDRRRRWLEVLGVIAWFLAVSVWSTWPLARDPATTVPSNLFDPLENVWIFGWSAHAIIHQPLHLFHGNILNPEAHTLAFAENMLGLSLPVAPVFWLTRNGVLTVNIALLLLLAFSGLGMLLLLRKATGSLSAGLVAGTAWAVVPYRIATLGHPHVVAMHLIPLILWLLLRLAVPGRTAVILRRIGLLGVAVGAQLWSSLTGGVTAFVAIGTWSLWCLARHRQRAFPTIGRAILGTALGVLLALPVLVPYLRVREAHPGYTHPSSETIHLSATPGSFLAPPIGGAVVDDLYEDMGKAFRNREAVSEKTLFPGLVLSIGSLCVALAWAKGAAASRSGRHRRHRLSGGSHESPAGDSPAPVPPAGRDLGRSPLTAWAVVGLGASVAVVGFVVALGPRYGAREGGLPLPFLIMRAATGGLTRVPARMGLLVPLGLSLVLGGGLAALSARPRRLVAALALIVLVAESAPSVTPVLRPPAITAAHRAIGRRPGVVLALPTGEFDSTGALMPFSIPREAQHMYLSTSAFYPLVNGYGAYQPPSYWVVANAVQDFPSEAAFETLGRRDVRTIIVQTDLVKGTKWDGVAARLDAWPGVRLLDTGPGVRTYDISIAVGIQGAVGS